CAGHPPGEAAAPAGAWTSSQSVTRDVATSFSARALDAAGNASVQCASVTFYQDGTAPAKPTIDTVPSTTAAAPSNNTSPNVIGTAEAGPTNHVYRPPS